MTTGQDRPGVLLMTYGAPASTDRSEVGAYLDRVRGGRPPDPALVDEFARRYAVIGGSPLTEVTRAQAAALADVLGWPVETGMRFAEPSIEVGLDRLRAMGATRVAAIILSPQYSPLLMSGYGRALAAAREAHAGATPDVTVAGAWHLEPEFVASLAARVVEALACEQAVERAAPRVLLTAHSVPRAVADQEPGYVEQLRATAQAVAARAGLASDAWTFCWQSAGHAPGAWMRPDLEDAIAEVASAGGEAVVVAPVQFLSDHLEVLYDLDIAAAAQAEGAGVAFHRVASLNDDPGLMAALAAVARRTLGTA